MNVSPAQCRASRGLLNWSQQELADKCGLNKQTISNFEAERSTPSKSTLEIISKMLEFGGVELSDGDGTKRKAFGSRVLVGRGGLYEMYEDFYKIVSDNNDYRDFWLYNGVSHIVGEALGDNYRNMHVKRMQPYLNRITCRVIMEHGDDLYWGSSYAQYKWISRKYFNNKTIYVYGNRVAVVDFSEGINITMIENDEFAETQRLFLETIWEAKAYDPITDKAFKPNE